MAVRRDGNTKNGREALPQNIDAERAVLGSILLDASVIDPVRDAISESDFYKESHRLLFRRMMELHDGGKPIDLTVLSDLLKKHGELDVVGGHVYIANLEFSVLSTGAAAEHAKIIADHSANRRMIGITQKIREASENGESPESVQAFATAQLEEEARRNGQRGGLVTAWARLDVVEAIKPRPPMEYLLEGFIPAGSLFMISGKGGDLKTRALMDMAVSLSAGEPNWPRKNHENTGSVFRIPKRQRVLWYNFDSPTYLLSGMIGCTVRGHESSSPQLAASLPLDVYSFPDPRLDFFDQLSTKKFAQFLAHHKPGLCIIDNLQVVRGKADENSNGDMAIVASNMRWVVESTGCSICVIHHHGKEQQGQKSRYRGASAMRDLVDFTIDARREEDKPDVMLIPDKQRFAPVKPFAVGFRYKHIAGTKDIWTSFFESVEVRTERDDLREDILQFVQEHSGCTLSELDFAMMKMKHTRAAVRSMRTALIDEGEIAQSEGKFGAKCLSMRCE